MIRVLHLMSGEPDMQTHRCSQLLAREAGADVRITQRRIGRGNPDRNLLITAARLMRQTRQFDLLHIWDESSLFAAMAWAGPIVFSPSRDLTTQGQRVLGWIQRRRRVHIVCSCPWQRRFMMQRSHAPEDVLLISPPVVEDRSVRLPALRRELGLADSDKVLLTPGESTCFAGHDVALWATSIVHVLNPGWRLLVWGRGDQTDRLLRQATAFKQPRLLCAAERTLRRSIAFEELTAVADLVLFTPQRPSPILPLLMCMAAGLPIVSVPSGADTGLLVDGQTAAVVENSSPKSLASRLLVLDEHQAMQEALASRVRVAAASFTPAKFVDDHCGLYRRICGR